MISNSEALGGVEAGDSVRVTWTQCPAGEERPTVAHGVVEDRWTPDAVDDADVYERVRVDVENTETELVVRESGRVSEVDVEDGHATEWRTMIGQDASVRSLRGEEA